MPQINEPGTTASRRSSKLKKPFVIAGLILFFGFDELVLVFLFFKIGFPRLPALAWVVIALAVTLLNLGLALVVYKAIMIRPSTGVGGLIGQTGTVLASFGQRGKVFVGGEHWEADFLDEVSAGDEIRVVSVTGLRLGVKRKEGGPSERTDEEKEGT